MNPTRAKAFLVVISLCLGSTQTHAAGPSNRTTTPTVVTDLKPLLIAAIAQGQAHGILEGAGAAYVQRRFETTNPIEITVRRLSTLPQAGCARLEVTTRQQGVLINTKRNDQALTYALSYCRDGTFPEKPR